MEKQKTEQILKRLEIVVAEPDNEVMLLYDLYLKNWGVSKDRVFLTRDGKECLEIFKIRNDEQIKSQERALQLPINHNILIIILDLHLRDISSLLVAKEIMRINPQQKMIITTTLSQGALENKAKELELINAIKDNKKILIKPFRFSQLLPLIQTTLSNPAGN